MHKQRVFPVSPVLPKGICCVKWTNFPANQTKRYYTKKKAPLALAGGALLDLLTRWTKPAKIDQKLWRMPKLKLFTFLLDFLSAWLGLPSPSRRNAA